MIVLLTPPEFRPDEATLLNQLLEAHPDLLVHIRKPESTTQAVSALVRQLDTSFHPRLIIHQHYELEEVFDLKGIHLTTWARKTVHLPAVSTSFHTLAEAIREQEHYRYFFCSPVFPSISKTGYAPAEQWNIRQQSTHFSKKAVALGGISEGQLVPCFERGFRHVAVLGAVWLAADPIGALHTFERAYWRTFATFAHSDEL